MSIDRMSVLAPADILWRDVGGEMVLLDQDGRRILGLNRTGGAVWSRLDGKRSLSSIAEELAEASAIELERAESDVLSFARLLVEKNLAKLVAP